VQYLLFYAEIIDKNCKNRAYADLGHITAMAPSITDIPDVSESVSDPPKQPSAGPINISLIGAAAFAKAARAEGSQTFSLSLKDEEVSGRSATMASSGSDMEGVPKCYHDFADVFSKVKPKT